MIVLVCKCCHFVLSSQSDVREHTHTYHTVHVARYSPGRVIHQLVPPYTLHMSVSVRMQADGHNIISQGTIRGTAFSKMKPSKKPHHLCVFRNQLFLRFLGVPFKIDTINEFLTIHRLLSCQSYLDII